jgi:Recombination endonuclease VII
MIYCSFCQKDKMADLFRKERTRYRGHYKAECISCYKLRVSMRNRENLLRKYNLSSVSFKSALDLQDRKCAICRLPDTEFPMGLCVDHCHRDNKVRGLLCFKCNAALGHFKDSIDILKNAVQYLYQPPLQGVLNEY